MNDTLFIHSQDQLRELARDVLRYASDMGASDAAVQISEGSGLSVTVRRGNVETIEQNKDKGIAVTVYMGKSGAVRRGSASTSDFSQGSLKATVEAAWNIARFTAADEQLHQRRRALHIAEDAPRISRFVARHPPG